MFFLIIVFVVISSLVIIIIIGSNRINKFDKLVDSIKNRDDIIVKFVGQMECRCTEPSTDADFEYKRKVNVYCFDFGIVMCTYPQKKGELYQKDAFYFYFDPMNRNTIKNSKYKGCIDTDIKLVDNVIEFECSFFRGFALILPVVCRIGFDNNEIQKKDISNLRYIKIG